MTTTNDWLKTADASHLAFSLVFEGYNLVYTTSSDTAGIATAFAGTDWTTVKSGLLLTGTIGQEIELFKPRIATNSMSFRIADADGTIRTLLLGSPTTDAVTYAKDDLSASGTNWNVRDTTDFGASGTIYTGSEAIAYTTKAGAPDHSFSGFTRGKWSLWGTSTDDRMGKVHRGQVPRPIGVNGPRLTPEIRNNPNVWYNRSVVLLMHHCVDGVWSTVTLPLHEADCKVVWAGRIKEWSDSGDGTIEISALSINELLTSTVFADQYEAEAASVFGYFRATHNLVRIEYVAPTGGTVTPYKLTGTMSPVTGWSDGFYQSDDLVAQIQEQLNDWTGDSTKIQYSGGTDPYHRWAVELRQTQDGVRVVFEVESTSSVPDSADGFKVFLHPKVWNTLGFNTEGDALQSEDVKRVLPKKIGNAQSATRTLFYLVGDSAPKMHPSLSMIGVDDYVPVVNETGVWMPQPTLPAECDPDAEGYIQIGEKIFAVVYERSHDFGTGSSTTSASAFRIVHEFQAPSTTNDQRGDIRGTIEENAEPLRIKQVWVERGKVGELLAKTMLSTGSSGYNEPSFDVYAEGFGIGVPYELVDVDTFRTMEIDYELFLERPTPFKELLEEVCAVYGRHIVFSGGRLTLTRPGFDSPESEDIIELDEDSKSDSPGRPEVRYSTDGIINRIELVYSTLDIRRQKVDPQSTYQFTTVNRVSNRIVVSDATSESAYGHRRTLQIAAKGILDESAWAEYVAKPIITHFSRPFAIITRTISARGSHIVPGDIILITDNYVVDPATGERGAAGLACWVRSTEFDWSRGAGRVELVFMPDHDASRIRKVAPSALYVSYNAGTKVTTLADHAYSRAGDAVDASHFDVGDIVQLREISPVTISAPDVQTDTVFARSGSTITGTVGWTPIVGRTYVVESVPVTSPTSPASAQRARAYLADGDTRKVDGTYAASGWAGSAKSLDAFTSGVTYTQQFVKPADDDGDADQPLSSRKLVNAFNNCNNLLAYKTRNVLVSHVYETAATTSSTSYVMVFGPIWVPLYGVSPNAPMSRTLVGKVLLGRSGGGGASATVTFRLTSSVSMPSGSSMTGVNFPFLSIGDESTYTTATSSPPNEWQDLELTPLPMILDGQVGTWLTGELKTSNATGIVAALSVAETKIA